MPRLESADYQEGYSATLAESLKLAMFMWTRGHSTPISGDYTTVCVKGNS